MPWLAVDTARGSSTKNNKSYERVPRSLQETVANEWGRHPRERAFEASVITASPEVLPS